MREREKRGEQRHGIRLRETVARERLFQFLKLGFRGITRREVKHLLHVLNDGVQSTVLMIRRTAELKANRTVLSDMVLEFLDEPRLTNARLATEQHDLAFALCGLLPAPLQ